MAYPQMRGSWVWLAAGALCACGPSGNGAGWSTTADTTASGAVHVVNTPVADPAPEWTLEEMLRVGSVDDSGPSSFAGLRGLVVFDDGGFAVLDGISQEVRVFGPTGTHLATWGGKGRGPGEFEGANGLMMDGDGMLWVPDHQNARMSVLDPRTGFLRSAPRRSLMWSFVWSGALVHADQVWKPSISLGPPPHKVMRVYDSDMTLTDTFPLPPDPKVDPEDPPGSFFWQSADGESRAYFGVPYFPQGEMLIDPRGAVWSTAYGDATYRIARWEPGGDTTLVLETRRAPVEIPAAERDSSIASIREEMAQYGGGNQDWSKVPTTRPAVAGMFLSEEGELWVRTPAANGELLDVYDPFGRHLRTVRNPLHLYTWVRPHVRGDQLWAVVVDDLDVQYVVRARMAPAPGGDGR